MKTFRESEMKSDTQRPTSIDYTDITHIYCGTPKCCGDCETASVWSRIKRSISNIYSYWKGIGVYLKYGTGHMRRYRGNRRK